MKRRYWMLNPKAKVIVDSLRANPERWSLDQWPEPYTLIGLDQEGNRLLEVWVSNGWWFVSIWRPTKEHLGLIGRTLVWMEYRRWLKSPAAATEKGDLDHTRNQAAIDALREA